MDNSCRYCKNRTAECHTTCDEYREFAEWCRLQRKKRTDEARIASTLDHMEYKRVTRR